MQHPGVVSSISVLLKFRMHWQVHTVRHRDVDMSTRIFHELILPYTMAFSDHHNGLGQEKICVSGYPLTLAKIPPTEIFSTSYWKKNFCISESNEKWKKKTLKKIFFFNFFFQKKKFDTSVLSFSCCYRRHIIFFLALLVIAVFYKWTFGLYATA